MHFSDNVTIERMVTCLYTAAAGLGLGNIWTTDERSDADTQDYATHPVAVVVWTMSSDACRRDGKGMAPLSYIFVAFKAAFTLYARRSDDARDLNTSYLLCIWSNECLRE